MESQESQRQFHSQLAQTLLRVEKASDKLVHEVSEGEFPEGLGPEEKIVHRQPLVNDGSSTAPGLSVAE